MRNMRKSLTGALALLMTAALVFTLVLTGPLPASGEKKKNDVKNYFARSQSVAGPWLSQGYGVLIEVGSTLNAQGKLVIQYAVFYPSDFQGPKGDTGPMGPEGLPGPAGPQGISGAQGEEGPQGLPGSAGAEGDMGPEGLPGPMGLMGDAGAEGPAGPDGPQGETGLEGPQGAQGPEGIQGPQGDQGPEGPQGIQGPQGDRGYSPTAHYHNFKIGAPTYKTNVMN